MRVLHGFLFVELMNSTKTALVIVAELHKNTEIHLIVYFILVNYIVCELHVNKTITKKRP